MLLRRIASRYAEALFVLAQQLGKAAEWEQELQAVAQVIETTPELREVLTHPEIALEQKEQVITKAFQGGAAPEVLALLFLLLKRGHDPDIRTVHEIFLGLLNKQQQILPVTVTSAVPLSEDQAQALSQAIAKREGASVQLQQIVDPLLIAGLVVKMGDRVIDASAQTVLNDLHDSMAGI